jgi:hypothetical protein
MELRVTKLRVTLAGAVVVLAGAGLTTVLGPVVGDALATAGQIVNISDPTAANTAKVDATGALKTTAAVNGTVGPALPRLPFRASRSAPTDNSLVAVTFPTAATLAITHLSFANLGTSPILIFLYLRGQSSTSSCDLSVAMSNSRVVDELNVPPGDTVEESLTMPLVLKPLAVGPIHCLLARGFSSTASPGYAVTITGWVPSGTYSGAS